ncbi:MAG: GNAT family N-acetyltransferase, partial [Gammaproteobacteria bacterium]|nr:GNAT family N-acetyltransferase [Gammaproteobacteria bacterium]
MIESRLSVILADWETYQKELRKIREVVFIKEQSVPKEEEWDGHDEESWHFLALAGANRPIGCARLMQSGQIGRMAVLKENRGLGVGALLLNFVVEHAKHLKMDPIFLHAQTYA